MTVPERFDTASIAIPTAGKARFVETLLEDLRVLQFGPDGVEAVVVDDAHSAELRRLVRDRARGFPFPLRYVEREGHRGLNSARNTGVSHTRGELILFLDDDSRVPRNWLLRMLEGAAAAPEAEAYGGPIELEIEGNPRWCGCGPFPATELDRGPADRWIDVVYGANMVVRRSALARVGLFDEEIPLYGEEVEWQQRLRRNGGLIRYVAAARVGHTRDEESLRLPVLLRTSISRGAKSQRFHGGGPAPNRLRLTVRIARGMAHALRRRCWIGVAHSLEAASALWVALPKR